MRYVTVTNSNSRKTLEIINWYNATFEYKRITTYHKSDKWYDKVSKFDTYHTLGKKDFRSIARSARTNHLPSTQLNHNLRFMFKTLEDKTLFNLIWR